MVAPSSLKTRDTAAEQIPEETPGQAPAEPFPAEPVPATTAAAEVAAVDQASAEPASNVSWLGRIGRGLGVVLLSIAILAVTVLIVVPRATGSQTYSVLTSSMAPKYAPGTFLAVQPVPFDELKLGDVVTYQIQSGQPGVITHRVVGFGFLQTGEKTLTTKGDNNDVADPEPVREVQIRGKLLYAVPVVGFVANALGNSDRSLWLAVGAAGLIGYGGFTMFRGAKAARKERRVA
ncbi:signal peptidase I [Paenarthrobacter sp. NPDC092416]|uniref:signal peptidase I n=1 Tax=Paenarthrobacter sp. NPDC092416 TaxID=3364386 RepID=UPI0038071209